MPKKKIIRERVEEQPTVTPLIAGGVYKKDMSNGEVLYATVSCLKELSGGGREGLFHAYWDTPRVIQQGSDDLNSWFLVK